MELDERKLRQVSEKADVEMEEPTKRQIIKFIKKGDRVSYIGRDNKYRSGGFVMSVAEDGSSMALSGGNFRWTLRTETIDTIFVVKKNSE
jgi:hypothetical protein